MSKKQRRILELKLTPETRKFLPENARQAADSESNKAIVDAMRLIMSNLDGLVRSMSVEGDVVKIQWEQSLQDREPIESIIPFLRKKEFDKAILLLELFLSDEPDEPLYLYNLGMVYSDVGEFSRAIHLFKRLTAFVPDHTNAHIALGVALTRNGEMDDAVRHFELAISYEPDNALSHRNLGATLAELGRKEEAVSQLHIATELDPNDQAAWYGLGQALELTSNIEAADDAYQKAIEIDELNQIAELSRKARSLIAAKNFRATTPQLERMDAVMYCLGALEKFESMNLSEVQKIGFEIAILCTRGISINDPARQYTLRSLPGSFSGLHLLCLEYVAFKKFAPEQDIGFDLSTEFRTAQSLYQQNRK